MKKSAQIVLLKKTVKSLISAGNDIEDNYLPLWRGQPPLYAEVDPHSVREWGAQAQQARAAIDSCVPDPNPDPGPSAKDRRITELEAAVRDLVVDGGRVARNYRTEWTRSGRHTGTPYSVELWWRTARDVDALLRRGAGK